jgi:hypothetical protein
MTEDRERFLPAWMPNPIDSMGLFVVEALTVLVLAIVAIGVAMIALWIY